MHLWTDNPPEFLAGCSKTLTKFQYVSARDHAGDASSAAKTLIPRDVIDTGPVRPKSLSDYLITSAGLDDIPKPEPLIEHYLDSDTLARLTGKSNHGKSFVALDMALCVASGRAWHGHQVTQGPVVYMVAEGARGIKSRVRAWEWEYNEGRPTEGIYFLPTAVQVGEFPQFIEAVSEVRPALVVLDTQARITVGQDENSAQDMGILVANLESLREATGACVLTVHHLGHQGEHGRGSTAVYGALGTELRVEKNRNTVVVYTSKQKDMEFSRPLTLMMERQNESLILRSETPGDPLATDSVVDAGSPPRDKVIYVGYSAFNNSLGGSMAEYESLALKHYAMTKTTFKDTWGNLVDSGLLVMCESVVTGKPNARFRPAAAEIARLGLHNLPKLA